MRLLSAAVLLAAAALLLPETARAEGVVVRAEAQTLGVDCGGGDALVEGNRNTLAITGACRSLTLRGNGNRLSADLGSDAHVIIEGNGNTLRYTTAAGGRAPDVRVSGSDTDVSAIGIMAGQLPSAEKLRLYGDNQHLDLDCAGRDVDIEGSHARFVLSGGCRSLEVRGEGDLVRAALAPAAHVDVEGNGTNVTYTLPEGAADAQVVVRGNDSHAARVDSMTAPAPAPMPPAMAANALPKPPSPAPQPAKPPARQSSEPTAEPAPAAIDAAPPVIAPTPAGVPGLALLMHDLNGKVQADGTLVSFQADALFDGGGGLRDGAAQRLGMLASLINQIHPSGVRIVSADPADAVLAGQRASALRSWLGGPGQVRVPIQATDTNADQPHLDVLIRR